MNNNKFLSKTVKTFMTSLLVSVFVFGSFYFLLSDNSNSSETTRNTAEVKSETSKKLVVDEEEKTPTQINEELAALSNDSVSKTVETERDVLGAQTSNLIAANLSDMGNAVVNTVVQTTPTAAITGTLPSSLVTNNSALVASGVPKTGNESLYAILGIFSLVTGFFIANGKSLAMRSFEQEI
jgi:uncharacterized protein related to proFAR isomerase